MLNLAILRLRVDIALIDVLCIYFFFFVYVTQQQESRPDSKEVRKTEKDTTRPDTNLKSDAKSSTLSLS